MEDMWEKGRKIEFPWLFSKSGAQNIHIVTANWMWANFDETSVPNTLLNEQLWLWTLLYLMCIKGVKSKEF